MSSGTLSWAGHTERSELSREPQAVGLYVHLPFCLNKCPYCDFYSIPLAGADVPRYLAALESEMALRAPQVGEAATVYLGGGTPTALPGAGPAGVLREVQRRFRVSPEAEVTVEANPGTVTRSGLRRLLAAGANRLSLGVQSFCDENLRRLGRIHSAAQARRAVAAAREAGFANLSLDLIFAIPGQTLASWEEDLEQALALAPEHLSVYGLTFEPGTPLHRALCQGEVRQVDERLEVRMFRLARTRLGAAGYRHYEISNYALPGRESRHNLNYWRGGEYVGLGASAHSYLGGVRWENVRGVGEYTHRLEAGTSPIRGMERLSAVARVGERLMLGLRLAEGLAEGDLAAGLGQDSAAVYGNRIGFLVQRRLLARSQGRLMLTARGQLVANSVLASLLASGDGQDD